MIYYIDCCEGCESRIVLIVLINKIRKKKYFRNILICSRVTWKLLLANKEILSEKYLSMTSLNSKWSEKRIT